MKCAIGKAGVVLLAMTLTAGAAETDQMERIALLEEKLNSLTRELQELRTRQSVTEQKQVSVEAELSRVDESVSDWNAFKEPLEKVSFGGYGELHANFTAGEGKDYFDIHRLVFYMGYEFNDWIRLHSETEIEHAYATKDDGGEVIIEQLYVDFLLSDLFNVRLGRVLAPLGITNQRHEPTEFLGVERPAFDKYLVPSTWSMDGIGIFGSPAEWINYQLYLTGGLDGSNFNSKDGIRGGRNKERPSLNEPAVSGRVDFYPFRDTDLRLGFSGYAGGLDNGNKGSDPGIDGDLLILSSDFSWNIGRLILNGAVAHEEIDGADEIGNGTADEIFGWYLEAGLRIMPDSWKTGKLKDADLIPFVRYDDYDTQYRLPSGVTKNPAGDRSEVTVGVNFPLTSQFVLKADYQFRDADSADAFNLGAGWNF